VNIITDDNDLGPFLTQHPDVAKIGFTGSTSTGIAIMRSASDMLKRVTLELGGNDPAIVLPDVDVRKAASGVFAGAFLNAGQVCLAVKRAYVHEAIYDEFCEALADLAEESVVDDGLKQGTTVGPIQNAMQYEKVKAYLAGARDKGDIIAGGAALDRLGYFVPPTIVRDVTDGDSIVDEEQFGPILPVVKFTDVNDVIKRANDSDYGLGGSVWTSDEAEGVRIANEIETGTIWVNQHINIGPHIPMAGYKSSGLGVEQSNEGLDEYTRIRVVNVARAGAATT